MQNNSFSECKRAHANPLGMVWNGMEWNGTEQDDSKTEVSQTKTLASNIQYTLLHTNCHTQTLTSQDSVNFYA